MRKGVYFLRAETGHIKIGFSENVDGRIRGLQTGCPVELVLVGFIKGEQRLEAELHLKFAEFRTRGEWFVASPDLLEFIDALDSDVNYPKIEPKARIKAAAFTRPIPTLRASAFGGCIICNRPPIKTNLCRFCIDNFAALDSDPKYPENDPEAIWQGAHGQEDIFDRILGPSSWPIDERLVQFIRNRYLFLIPNKPVRGAHLTLPLSASYRLAGAFVLRQLTDEGLLEAFDGGDGFYFAARTNSERGRS